MKKKKNIEGVLEAYRKELQKVEREYSEKLISFDCYLCDRNYLKGSIRALEYVLDIEVD